MSYPGPAQDFLAATAERDLSGLRVAYSADLGFAAVDADVRAAFRVAVERFAELGCWPVEGHPPTGNPNDLWNRIALAEGYASEGALLAQWESQMTPGTADIIRAGLDVTAADYLEAVHERAAFTRCWSEFYEEFDLLLTPCMQLTAFEVGLLTPASIEGRPVDPFFDDWCTLVLPANLTGQPAASVPMGFAADGLPVGLQIMGRRFDDATVLAAASAYERLAPWADRWPPVT